MPYEYVEFEINPPIRESIGKVPDDIKLLEDNGVLRVLLGENTVEKIKNSEHFKKIIDESEKQRKHSIDPQDEQNLKSKNYINQLEEELRRYGTQKAKNFINQLNFNLNSSAYDIQLTTLAILCLQRQKPYGVGGYVKSELKTDIYEIADNDNLLSRMLNSYANGLKALKNKDYVNAYKCFYYIFPDRYVISNDPTLNLDLKLLRDASSHIVLGNKNLMDRAKELLGEEHVKTDKDGKKYAYIEPLVQKHMDLFIQYMPKIQKYSREYIDNYVKLHI